MKIGGVVSFVPFTWPYMAAANFVNLNCHVTKIKKYQFTSFGSIFALENSKNSLHRYRSDLRKDISIFHLNIY